MAVSNEELIKRIRSGEDARGNLEKLYLQNEAMIIKMAMRFAGYAEIDDLKQEAYFGMVEAVERWDESKGASFSTFAHKWIEQSMQRYVSRTADAIRIPEYQRNLIIRYNRAIEDFLGVHHRKPTPSEVAELLNISTEQAERIELDALAMRPRSISEGIGEGLELGDTIESPQNEIEELIEDIDRQELKAVLWGCVDGLEQSEADIIRRRYQNGRTIKACSEEIGTSIDCIRKIESRAIRKLRKPSVKARLRPYVEDTLCTIAYKTGLGSFMNSWTSAPERAVLFLEQEAGQKAPKGKKRRA